MVSIGRFERDAVEEVIYTKFKQKVVTFEMESYEKFSLMESYEKFDTALSPFLLPFLLLLLFS